jgi:hypothetical protein
MDPWDSPIARRRLKLWPNDGTRRTAAKRLLAGDALNDILAAFPRGPRTTKDNGALASRTARRTYAQYALRQEAVYAGLVPPIDPANVATIRGEARKQDIAWIACRTGLNPEKVKAILKLKGPARNSGTSGAPAAAVPADPGPAMSAQVRQCIARLSQAPKLPLRTLGELEVPRSPGIYALWFEAELLYVGIARKSPGSTSNPQAAGIAGRLSTYRNARLTSDFTIAVAFRFIVPHLTAVDLASLATGEVGVRQMHARRRRGSPSASLSRPPKRPPRWQPRRRQPSGATAYRTQLPPYSTRCTEGQRGLRTRPRPVPFVHSHATGTRFRLGDQLAPPRSATAATDQARC